MKRARVTTTSIGLLLLFLAAGTAQSQTPLSETTWAAREATSPTPWRPQPTAAPMSWGLPTASRSINSVTRARVFVVKFAADGSLTWQRVWNGTTIRGLGRPDVAVSSDGSVYVTGVTAANGNDAVLLKFDTSGTLLWERTWGGTSSDESLAVATASDRSAYIAGTATSFGPSSASLAVVKFDSAGNLVWQNNLRWSSGECRCCRT